MGAVLAAEKKILKIIEQHNEICPFSKEELSLGVGWSLSRWGGSHLVIGTHVITPHNPEPMVAPVVCIEVPTDDQSSVLETQGSYDSKEESSGNISTTDQFPVPGTQEIVAPMKDYGDDMSTVLQPQVLENQEGIDPKVRLA